MKIQEYSMLLCVVYIRANLTSYIPDFFSLTLIIKAMCWKKYCIGQQISCEQFLTEDKICKTMFYRQNENYTVLLITTPPSPHPV